MTNLWKTLAKPCAKSWVNFVYIFVDFPTNTNTNHFSTTLFPRFHHPFHSLFNNFSSPVPIKTFPLFHSTYYYYNDLLNNNYNNRKELRNGN